MWRATASAPVFGGVAFFLLSTWYKGRVNHCDNLEPDAVAVLDLATEEWRPATLQGPLSSRLTGDDEKLVYRDHRKDFRLAAMNGCLVSVHRHNRFKNDPSIDLWFLEDMDVDKAGLWTKRYSIRCATYNCRGYASSDSYPLLVLDDGRIAMWDEGSAHALRAYDPITSSRDDLATLTNCSSMSVYQGNLL